MNARRNKLWKTAAFAAVLALVAGLAWAFLSIFHPPYAEWLTVEAPARIVAGERVDIRVTLGQVPEPSVLVADLYLLARDHDPVGSARSLDPSPTVKSGGSYTFRFDVERKEKLALVQFVIYLSPDGRWRDRTRGASTVAVPVKPSEPGAGRTAYKKILAYDIHTSNPETPFHTDIRPEPYVPPRAPTRSGMILFVLLAFAGAVFVQRAYRPWPVRRTDESRDMPQGNDGGSTPGANEKFLWKPDDIVIDSDPDATRASGLDRKLWLVSAAVLFLLAFSELFLLEGRVAALGRKIAAGMDIYYFRQPLQKAVMALMAAGVAAIVILAARSILRNRGRRPLTLAGLLLILYLGLALAGALSFHYVDRFEAIRLYGFSMIHAVKALCAAAILALGLFALFKKKA